MRDVLTAAADPRGELGWIEINRIAARRLHPESGDSSRLGHAFVLELAASGLVEAEVTRSADGTPMAALVRGRHVTAATTTVRPIAA